MFKVHRPFHITKVCMPSRCKECHKREGWGVWLEIDCGDVSVKVVDPCQREVPGIGKSLGKGDTHKERSDQAGPTGDGNTINAVRICAGVRQGRFDHRNNFFHMLSRCQLRNNATIRVMYGHLRPDHIGQDGTSFRDHGSGCLIARGLDSQN
jgi:hypothetical protein